MRVSITILLLALMVAVLEAGALLPPVISSSLGDLVRVASDTCEKLPLDILFASQNIPDVKILLFSKNGKSRYSLNKAHTYMPPRSNLVVYISGWWNTPQDESSDAIVSAILRDSPYIMVVDTHLSFSRGYVSSASQVNIMGYRLFKFIKNLFLQGNDLSGIHLIGFSLGAHVAGITGHLVQKRLQIKVNKITALDPARPCFLQPSKYRLKKSDANFVYVIHTSSGVIGLEAPIGHVDIYVNGLTSTQPECQNRAITLECDHAASWKLYTDSIKNDTSIIGQRCKNWSELKIGQCTGDKVDVGYNCDPTTRGLFIHQTPKVKTEMRVFNLFDVDTWLRR